MEVSARRHLNCPNPDALNALAVYHTALATARKKNHTLVSERRVDEAWVVEYNPHCLEAVQSNMAIRLVMHTPNFVIDYITKGGGRAGARQQQKKESVTV